MARINIEDTIWTDSRFINYMLALKNMDLALGSLVRAWMLAQKWYLRDDGLIPLEIWNREAFPKELIECGLAEKIGDDFVRVCGSDEQFSWLKQRVEAGRKGGSAQRGKKLGIEEASRRQAARIMLAKAIKSGEVVKAQFCEDCGAAVDIHGHHSDYSKPLAVNWLCRTCHNKTHKAMEDLAKRSLNDRSTGVKPHSLPLSPALKKEKNKKEKTERVTDAEWPRGKPAEKLHVLVQKALANNDTNGGRNGSN